MPRHGNNDMVERISDPCPDQMGIRMMVLHAIQPARSDLAISKAGKTRHGGGACVKLYLSNRCCN